MILALVFHLLVPDVLPDDRFIAPHVCCRLLGAMARSGERHARHAASPGQDSNRFELIFDSADSFQRTLPGESSDQASNRNLLRAICTPAPSDPPTRKPDAP